LEWSSSQDMHGLLVKWRCSSMEGARTGVAHAVERLGSWTGGKGAKGSKQRWWRWVLCLLSVRASACHTSRARWATRCPTTSPATFRAHSLGFISYDLWGQGGTDPPVPSTSSLRRQSFSWSLSVGSDNLAGKNRIGKHEFHRNKHFLFKSTLIWV
jgi:hypothetical protein